MFRVFRISDKHDQKKKFQKKYGRFSNTSIILKKKSSSEEAVTYCLTACTQTIFIFNNAIEM